MSENKNVSEGKEDMRRMQEEKNSISKPGRRRRVEGQKTINYTLRLTKRERKKADRIAKERGMHVSDCFREWLK